MKPKKAVGRPSLFEASYVHAIAEQVVLAKLAAKPRELKAALLRNPRYIVTLRNSERVLREAVTVRHVITIVLTAHLAKVDLSDEDIAFKMMLAARPNRYENRKRYIREEADPEWCVVARRQLDGTVLGAALVAKYRAVIEGKRRVDDNDPFKIETPTVEKAKRKAKARKEKLLGPEFDLKEEDEI